MNNKTEAEQLKSNYFKWHYENRDKIVPADIAEYWLNKMSEQKAKMVKEINSLFHEVQQDSIPIGNEDWKEGYNKALYNILEIINKQ